MPALTPPKGLLFDFGGTLVEEVGVDVRAANEMLLARAVHRPAHATIEAVLERANRVSAEVAGRRNQFQIETPWPALTRLIHDYFGTRFAEPMAELELAFWEAAVTTRPMPGAREALEAIHRLGVPMGVLSNSSFGPGVIRGELARHGLADRLAFVMASADYAVRKPNVLLFETAAARLGVEPAGVWFVGDGLDTDVAGARAAGMTAVWLRPPGAAPSDEPRLSVSGWGELVRRLADLY
ncbi:MAG TPA: HAD family hydrolase [Gemmatimonadaceae bacterium]|nr:HAD family hydrolase [Gemmatimonadaceae bacterium]